MGYSLSPALYLRSVLYFVSYTCDNCFLVDTLAYLSNGLAQGLQGCRVVFYEGHMVSVLRPLMQGGHHGISLLQQATVLSVSCLVPDQLLNRNVLYI